MSLILKGIDLPSKDKSPLVITVWADGVVCSVDSNGGIEETTSAIQIPKGHGRIIDASKVYCYNYWEEQNLDEAPTILEAEE